MSRPKKVAKQIRQGDLLFVQIEDVTGELTQDKVLAYGEVTGHKHQICPLDWPKVDVFKDGSPENLKLKVKQPVRVVHEEHRTIELTKGNWEVRRKREYHPAELRLVVD